MNPYYTKRVKELADNLQTKKDDLTISKLIKNDRYMEKYLSKEEYPELRSLSNTRLEITRSMNNCKNKIHVFVDDGGSNSFQDFYNWENYYHQKHMVTR